MITFAIPCYNSSLEYIKKAVLSVQQQTSEQWNIVIVDGNSQPSQQLQLLLDHIEDKRIRYVVNNNDKSMAGNWNYAFQSAETDLVTLLHDDDFLEPTYVERMIQVAEQYPKIAAFYTDVNLINDEGRPTKSIADSIKNFIKPSNTKGIIQLRGDEGLSALLKGCFIFCPTMCYRKSKLPRIPFNKNWKMVTDFQFYFDTLYSGKTIIGLNEKLYNYRRHNQNQTAKLTGDLKRFEEEVCFYNNVANVTMKQWPLSFYQAKRKRIIKLHVLFLILRSSITGNFTYVKKLIRFYYNKL